MSMSQVYVPRFTDFLRRSVIVLSPFAGANVSVSVMKVLLVSVRRSPARTHSFACSHAWMTKSRLDLAEPSGSPRKTVQDSRGSSPGSIQMSGTSMPGRNSVDAQTVDFSNDSHSPRMLANPLVLSV